MEKNDIESRKNKERNRLKRLLKAADVEDWKIQTLHQVIENTAWMSVKLEDTRQEIREAEVTVPYDNGGGQSGVRQNPIFQGYESLWKAYMAGMTQILTAAGVKKDQKSEKLKPRSVIQLVRSNQRQA
jgi:hypothetical protein